MLIVSFVQRLLQLLFGLVIEFFVSTLRLASLLPELVRPPDNIHFFGCVGHAVALFRCLEAGRGQAFVHVRPDISHAGLSFHSLTFFTARRKSFDQGSDFGRSISNTLI